MATRRVLDMFPPAQGNTGNYVFSTIVKSAKYDGVELADGTKNVRSRGTAQMTQPTPEKVSYKMFDFKASGGNLISKELVLEFEDAAAATAFLAEINGWQTASSSGATIAPALACVGGLTKLVLTSFAV